MFQTQRVGCYLNGFSGHGEDNDTKELKLVFHISPISPQLAAEIDPKLEDRLFRDINGEWLPAHEMTKANFSNIHVPMQNITFQALPDPEVDKFGVLIPGAAISNLRAQKAITDGFRLEFDVVVPMDGETMRLVEQYYKATCYLSMEAVQRDIEYAEGEEGSGDEQRALQGAADATSGDEPAAAPNGKGDGSRKSTKKKTAKKRSSKKK